MSGLLPRLRQSEGWRDRLYMDTTGNLTIGYGFNLARLILPPGVDFRDVRLEPVTRLPLALGEAWLAGLVQTVTAELVKALPWVQSLDEVRRGVLVDMAYNLGLPGLLKWPIFLGQVRSGNYYSAAVNMRSTLWARQVGARADRLARMMETGKESLNGA